MKQADHFAPFVHFQLGTPVVMESDCSKPFPTVTPSCLHILASLPKLDTLHAHVVVDDPITDMVTVSLAMAKLTHLQRLDLTFFAKDG